MANTGCPQDTAGRVAVRARKVQGSRKKQACVQHSQKKVALYARTSSMANAAGHSAKRQFQAAACALASSKNKKVNKVSEIISGMLPFAERTKLKKLLSGEFDTVLVESQRALARSAHTSEEVYRTAKKNKVNIIVQDMPTLYKLEATPAENFMRRVMGAVCEFERDTIVARLQAGLAAKRATTKRKTQHGTPKVQGRNSLLESAKPTQSQLRCLRSAVQKREAGEFGWRPLACMVKQILNLATIPTIEVVRRMTRDLQ